MTSSVVHLLAPSPVGGLEAVVERLVLGQQDRGGDVHVGAVVEPRARPHPFVVQLRRAGAPVHPLVIPHRSYLTEIRAVLRLLQRLDPEVVHTHGYRADILSGGVARREGWPVVSTVHGFTAGDAKNRLYELLQRRSLTRCDTVVAVSEPLGRELVAAGVDPTRLHVIRNAWSPTVEPLPRPEARRRLGLPEGAFVAGWVGRLSREKAPDLFLRMLARMNVEGVQGSIIGDGALEEPLRTLASRLNVGGRVRFHGRVPDAAQYYRAFDVFVLSSRTEGTPISLFEAVEAGVPVVATRVGGVPDVLEGEDSCLVAPGDPEALASAIEKIRGEPAAAMDRARQRRDRIRARFAPGPWLDRYEAIYREARSRAGG